MIPILLLSLTWAIAALGLGAAISPDVPRELRWAVAGFLGLLGLSALALAASVAGRVGPGASALALGAGAAGFLWRRRLLLDVPAAVPAATVAALVGVSALGRTVGRYHDQGLYYLQSVLWEQAHGATGGVARLHGRLGFNSAWFPLGALVELPTQAGAASFVLGAVPMAFAAAAVAGALWLLRGGDRSPETIALAFVAVPAAMVGGSLGSMNPDAPAALLVFLSLALWYRASARPGAFGTFAPLATAVGLFALSVKLSSAVVAAGGVLWLGMGRSRVPRRALGWTLGIAAALLVPWLVHGVVTSGCLAYPVAGSCLDGIPGAVARDEAVLEQAWIRSWARWPGRHPDEVLGSLAWVGPWARRLLRDPALAWLLLVGAVGGLAAARLPREARQPLRQPVALAAGGVLFWLATAPDPRFGLGAIAALALLPASAVLSTLSWSTALARGLGALAVGAVLAPGILASGWMLDVRRPGRADVWSLPRFPEPAVRHVRTRSGATVRVPVEGDQCWRTPLPCAPDGTPGLSLRGPYRPASP